MFLSPSVLIVVSLDEMIELDRLDLFESGQSNVSRPVETEVETQDANKAVQQFVASLPSQDRALVEGVFWNGRPQAEFARQLGVSRMAVTKKLKRIYRHGSARLAAFSPVNHA